MSEYMGLREAAKELGIHYETARRWVHEGRFPIPLVLMPEYVQQGKPRRHYRVARAAVEEWKAR